MGKLNIDQKLLIELTHPIELKHSSMPGSSVPFVMFWAQCLFFLTFLGNLSNTAENFHLKMVQKGLNIEFLDQKLFLAKFFLSGIAGFPPPPLTENIFAIFP